MDQRGHTKRSSSNSLTEDGAGARKSCVFDSSVALPRRSDARRQHLTEKQNGAEVRVAENKRRADTTGGAKGWNGTSVEPRDGNRDNDFGGFVRCDGKLGRVGVRAGGSTGSDAKN